MGEGGRTMRNSLITEKGIELGTCTMGTFKISFLEVSLPK